MFRVRNFRGYCLHCLNTQTLDKMKSIKDTDFQLVKPDDEFKYQKGLTNKLDKLTGNFDQATINEIVLWKVNRYAELTPELINQLNSINKTDTKMNEELTRTILRGLLSAKGIQLPMASTILRFKNPKIYQILDQRVFRIIYGEKLNLGYNQNNKKTEEQIEIYLEYLTYLREVSRKLHIEFELSDRILFMADRRINKDVSLDNYSNKAKDL
jgi:hypothetical protein